MPITVEPYPSEPRRAYSQEEIRDVFIGMMIGPVMIRNFKDGAALRREISLEATSRGMRVSFRSEEKGVLIAQAASHPKDQFELRLKEVLEGVFSGAASVTAAEVCSACGFDPRSHLPRVGRFLSSNGWRPRRIRASGTPSGRSRIYLPPG